MLKKTFYVLCGIGLGIGVGYGMACRNNKADSGNLGKLKRDCDRINDAIDGNIDRIDGILERNGILEVGQCESSER